MRIVTIWVVGNWNGILKIWFCGMKKKNTDMLFIDLLLLE